MENKISELINLVTNARGCQFATIVTSTDQKVKKGCPISGIKKMTAMGGIQIGYDYENAVNNHLEREGLERDFVAEKLPFGEWLVPNKVITHKGELYIRYYIPKSVVTSVTYIADGRELTPDEVAIVRPYFYATAGSSAKQTDAGLSEEQQVKPRAVKAVNVVALAINGKVYTSC